MKHVDCEYTTPQLKQQRMKTTLINSTNLSLIGVYSFQYTTHSIPYSSDGNT